MHEWVWEGGMPGQSGHNFELEIKALEKLVNVLVYAKEENDLHRRGALLVELSQLKQAWPQDAAVREQLAKASMIRQSDPNLKCRKRILFHSVEGEFV